MISICIPVHNQEDYTFACIKSIQANTNDYEIIVVDNGSDTEFDFTHIGWDAAEEYLIIRNKENLGFPRAVNQGIEAAHGDVIAILNNDCIVTPHWADIMQWHMANGIDMVGPVTNHISGPQQVLIDRYDDIPELYKAAEANREKFNRQLYFFHRLVFFCVMIKRKVIDKIGLLDEVYTPGNYEDDDYCMRAIDARFKIGIAQDCYVHHFSSVTHKAMDLDYQELIKRNRQTFTDKWNDRYEELARRNDE